uniref:DUF4283 domain-containing protein n=1 Tax=Chenopodium quinoa TaxID=63459 RepID=A0A803LHB2_CHEQI
MIDTQWLTRGNIVVHRTGCFFFACTNLADVEALLEQHTFVLDGRICNVRRCNRYTVPASANFDFTRLWIRVYGLPLGFLDPEWAVKTLELVELEETLDYDGDGLPEEPEFREFCNHSDYVASRRIHARMEAFEAQGRTVLYDPNNHNFYSNMVEGSQENFNTRNTRVNLIVLAQDFEYNDDSSGDSGNNDNDGADDNDDMDNENNDEGDDDVNDDDDEPPDFNQDDTDDSNSHSD